MITERINVDELERIVNLVLVAKERDTLRGEQTTLAK